MTVRDLLAGPGWRGGPLRRARMRAAVTMTMMALAERWRVVAPYAATPM
ncbi:MAG: hypothetical protein R2736_05530 [Solirubrobacterales bacterium]